MVRSYLRHGPTALFNLISNATSLPVYASNKFAFVSALEDVAVWDLKKGEQVAELHVPSFSSASVTALSLSPTLSSSTSTSLAVGYSDGSIRIWTFPSSSYASTSSATTESTYLPTFTSEGLSSAAVSLTLNGHKSAVTTFQWTHAGRTLLSGSKDTHIILWDIEAEVGLVRLKGHRGPIVGLEIVDEEGKWVLSLSEDTTLKLWDLGIGFCTATVVATRTIPASLAYEKGTGTILCGGGEGALATFSLTLPTSSSSETPASSSTAKVPTTELRPIKPLPPLALSTTSHTDIISQLTWLEQNYLGVLSVAPGGRSRSHIEIFRIRSEEEVRKKAARRKKREKEKGKKGKKSGGVEADEADEQQEDGEETEGVLIEWRDRLVSVCTVRSEQGKIKGFGWGNLGAGAGKGKHGRGEQVDQGESVSILLSLSNNSLETHSIPLPTTISLSSSKKTSSKNLPPPSLQYSLSLPGHRTDVRSLAVSSDDKLLASASEGEVKVWNITEDGGRCVRTLEIGGVEAAEDVDGKKKKSSVAKEKEKESGGRDEAYAICCSFLPGDKHLIVGTKSGHLYLYSLTSSSLLAIYPAHVGPLWSLQVRPDQKGLITGGADKEVRFWDFSVVLLDGGIKELGLEHRKTLKMTDDVLAVRYSPDGRFIAVSLLDSTVKVFFADTLKFALSLYGHKLPVLSLSISFDSKLIVTCSADKNIKIWGLDFGDCHRSLFAHDESIMQVEFEKGTHHFWSVGKDKMVKYWDADKFECIQKLEGHHAEVWALAVGNRGKYVATASHDKSIRLWEKTDEPLFLEEERERELEALYDTNPNSRDDRDALRVQGQDGENEESTATEVTKSTTETLMAGEKIIEALDISVLDQEFTIAYEDEVKEAKEKKVAIPPPPSRNAIFSVYRNIGPQEYVLKVVRAIPAASLQDALLVLPFAKVIELIRHLDFWAKKEWQITLTSRVLFSLLRTHHSQIVATRSLKTILLSLKSNLREALKNQKDSMGYNLAALRFVQRQHEANTSAEFYESGGGMVPEEEVREKIEKGIKKRKRAALKS